MNKTHRKFTKCNHNGVFIFDIKEVIKPTTAKNQKQKIEKFSDPKMPKENL